MKSIILTVILSVICYFSYAQNQDIEYMEVRFIAYKGIQYRLSPMSPFKRSGFFNKNLKPYFKEDEAAYKAFKQYRFNTVMMSGSSLFFSIGMPIAMFGVLEKNENQTIIGCASALSGIALMYYFNHKQIKRLREAIDFYNIGKNPNLSQIQPFIPTLQPSNQSVGVGLVWDINP